MIIEVQNGQTLFDIALLAYGDASLAYMLISENDQVDSIISDITGLSLNYTYSKPSAKETVKIIQNSQKAVTIKSTQTLFDVALQLNGNAESVVDLISANGIDSLVDDEYFGINVIYETSNAPIPVYFRKNNITISTRYPDNSDYRVTDDFDDRITDSFDLRIP